MARDKSKLPVGVNPTPTEAELTERRAAYKRIVANRLRWIVENLDGCVAHIESLEKREAKAGISFPEAFIPKDLKLLRSDAEKLRERLAENT